MRTTRASASLLVDSHRGTACLEQDARAALGAADDVTVAGRVERGRCQEVVREAVSELALRRLWMSNKRRRRKRLMIDVDGLPVQVHGQQPGSEYHGYYHQHRVVADARYVVDALRLQPLERFTVGKAAASMRTSTDSHTRCRQRSTTVWMNGSAPSADPAAPGRSVPSIRSPLSAQLATSAWYTSRSLTMRSI